MVAVDVPLLPSVVVNPELEKRTVPMPSSSTMVAVAVAPPLAMIAPPRGPLRVAVRVSALSGTVSAVVATVKILSAVSPSLHHSRWLAAV